MSDRFNKPSKFQSEPPSSMAGIGSGDNPPPSNHPRNRAPFLPARPMAGWQAREAIAKDAVTSAVPPASWGTRRQWDLPVPSPETKAPGNRAQRRASRAKSGGEA